MVIPKSANSKQCLTTTKSSSCLPNISTPLSTKGRGEKNKFICITSETTLTSFLLSLAFWERAIGVWNAREGTIRKRNIVEVRYANVVLQRGVSELHRMHPGENVVPVTECSLEMNVKRATKSWDTKKKAPRSHVWGKNVLGL